jgi:hypothetical protein
VSYASYVIYVALVALAVVANGGNGSKTHFAVQLYLIMLVALCTLGITAPLPA